MLANMDFTVQWGVEVTLLNEHSGKNCLKWTYVCKGTAQRHFSYRCIMIKL